MVKCTTLVAALVFALGPLSVSAQEPPELDVAEPDSPELHDNEGRMHFDLGTVMYRRGEFAGAAVEFQAAYDASHRTPLLYNVYVAYRDLGDSQRAAVALEAYLRLSPEAELREGRPVLEQRLRSLVEAHETRSAEREQGFESNPEPGHNEETVLESSTGEGPAQEHLSQPPGVPLGPIVLLSVGGVSMIGGLVTGLMALSVESDLEENCNMMRQCEPLYWNDADQADQLAIITDVLLFGGGSHHTQRTPLVGTHTKGDTSAARSHV